MWFIFWTSGRGQGQEISRFAWLNANDQALLIAPCSEVVRFVGQQRMRIAKQIQLGLPASATIGCEPPLGRVSQFPQTTQERTQHHIGLQRAEKSALLAPY
ncbi:MAG: hypothetical protein ACK5X3_13240 [Pseudomonadota bacterium]